MKKKRKYDLSNVPHIWKCVPRKGFVSHLLAGSVFPRTSHPWRAGDRRSRGVVRDARLARFFTVVTKLQRAAASSVVGSAVRVHAGVDTRRSGWTRTHPTVKVPQGQKNGNNIEIKERLITKPKVSVSMQEHHFDFFSRYNLVSFRPNVSQLECLAPNVKKVNV